MTNTPNLNRHVYGSLRIDSLEVESWVNIPEVIVELYDNETARNGSLSVHLLCIEGLMKSIGQKFFHVNDVTKKTVNKG